MKTVPLIESSALLKELRKGHIVAAYLNAEHYGEYEAYYNELFGFSDEQIHKPVTLLGEIVNQPGHVVAVGKNGKVVSGVHTDIFDVEIDD